MNQDNSDNTTENVCDLSYLSDMMGGKKHLILEIIDTFLQQVPQELKSMDEAILDSKYTIIKNLAHTMKSSVSIMGISILRPILQEMEDLGSSGKEINRIIILNKNLNQICMNAIGEMDRKKQYYI